MHSSAEREHDAEGRTSRMSFDAKKEWNSVHLLAVPAPDHGHAGQACHSARMPGILRVPRAHAFATSATSGTEPSMLS
jgi:hypothetical protein